MGKYKVVVFDLDGTLLDTLDDLTNSLNFALSQLGYPQRGREEVRSFVGNGVISLIQLAIPEKVKEEEFQQVLALFRQHYGENATVMTKPYPGVLPLLDRLQREEVKLAVVSNKYHLAVEKLSKEFFRGYFDAAVGEVKERKKKPAPDMVYYALEQLGFSKDKGVYVGDSEVDLETAKNAGMDCIMVNWGFRPEKELIRLGAKKVARSTEELYQLIMEP